MCVIFQNDHSLNKFTLTNKSNRRSFSHLLVTLPDTFFSCALTTIRKKINSILIPCGSGVILFIIFVLFFAFNFLVLCYSESLLPFELRKWSKFLKSCRKKMILISIIYSMMEDNKTCVPKRLFDTT